MCVGGLKPSLGCPIQVMNDRIRTIQSRLALVAVQPAFSSISWKHHRKPHLLLSSRLWTRVSMKPPDQPGGDRVRAIPAGSLSHLYPTFKPPSTF